MAESGNEAGELSESSKLGKVPCNGRPMNAGIHGDRAGFVSPESRTFLRGLGVFAKEQWRGSGFYRGGNRRNEPSSR